MKCTAMVLPGWMLVAACGGEQGPAVAMEEATGLLVADSLLAVGPRARAGEPVDLFNPTDIAVAGETVVVVDTGTSLLWNDVG